MILFIEKGSNGMSDRFPFLPDGPHRHQQAWNILFEKVETEVLAEYTEQLAGASFWQRLKLRRLIRQEVARRLPKPPSSSSLYGKS
jgi:hypothetical protein